MSPRHVRAAAIAAAVIVLAGASALLMTRSAEAATTSLAPIELTTTAGEVGRDQPVTNLHVRDLSGRSTGGIGMWSSSGGTTGSSPSLCPPILPPAPSRPCGWR